MIVNEGVRRVLASKLATEEFPNLTWDQRSAASIASRLQDPLAELVKIDPKPSVWAIPARYETRKIE